ncbi:autophagy-related protein 9A-like [Uloborus diversus]|uniref:autophagy-related protein 9A-like n=1 Tax=Uloborus diversus TaxID=327109 RepID=UPI00240A0F21|nr:autophagy-related protein 9A-like [Uloborus diversus]
MNSNLQTNYQSLVTDENEVPHESVIFHVASEGGKPRWNHVGDLDSFFRKIYTFHQKHGYICILLEESIRIVFFVLIFYGVLYFSKCIYFNFDEPSSPLYNKTDIHLSDLFIPPFTCAANCSGWGWLFMVVGVLLVVYKLYRLICTAYSYKEIEQFYDSAMKISKADINNVTWHEVQCRLREVQHEQQLCVHKSDLTELDIYHRILRHKNYMVAMVNKNILPLKHNTRFGEWVYLSSGLEYNLELLLFGSLSSPFKGTGTLREDYKKYSKRKEVAAELSRNILICGVINLLLSPFILVWQCLSFFVTYSGTIKYEPGYLGMRRWSRYSRLYLRHFNELDHEQKMRLSRAYEPAKEYMKSFSSPVLVIIAKNIAQVAGCVVVFFGLWGLIKEKLLMIDKVLLIIAVCGIIFYCTYSCVPDEYAVFVPNKLMHRMIADIHYAPDHFKEKAHTSAVRDEFSQLFQYRMINILEDLVSPVVTPIILILYLRHRALDIVDFFRSFTIEVAGVGDVCSFALMDVSKHGNHQWMSGGYSKADQYQQAEDGKTELSLIHFTLMNPHWEPPPSSNVFIHEFKQKVQLAKDHPEEGEANPFYTSLHSLSTLGSRYSSLANSLHQSIHQPCSSLVTPAFDSGKVSLKRVTHAEGPPYIAQAHLFTTTNGNDCDLHSLQNEFNPMEIRAADMSLSALYMHEVHHQNMHPNRSQEESGSRNVEAPENNGSEESPLLDVRM